LKTYEAVFILDEKKFDDGGEAFSQRVGEDISKLGGSLKNRDNMGRRQFARPIGKHTAGLYWDLVLDLPADKVTAFEDLYRLNEDVLRMQVFLYVEPPPAKAKLKDSDFEF